MTVARLNGPRFPVLREQTATARRRGDAARRVGRTSIKARARRNLLEGRMGSAFQRVTGQQTAAPALPPTPLECALLSKTTPPAAPANRECFSSSCASRRLLGQRSAAMTYKTHTRPYATSHRGQPSSQPCVFARAGGQTFFTTGVIPPRRSDKEIDARAAPSHRLAAQRPPLQPNRAAAHWTVVPANEASGWITTTHGEANLRRWWVHSNLTAGQHLQRQKLDPRWRPRRQLAACFWL